MINPFTGSGVALVTPFNEDLTIDFDALRKLVRYQIDNGTDFLVVQGTTGESPVLSKEEKLEVLKCVQEENNGKLKIVFGVGGKYTVGGITTPSNIDIPITLKTTQVTDLTIDKIDLVKTYVSQKNYL